MNWPVSGGPSAYLPDRHPSSLAASIAGAEERGGRFFIIPDLPYLLPAQRPDAAAGTAALQPSPVVRSRGVGGQFRPRRLQCGAPGDPGEPAILRLHLDQQCGGIGSRLHQKPAGVSSAWALLCSPDPSAPSHLVAPNADQVYLFADDQHLTTAGQKIVGDYFYSPRGGAERNLDAPGGTRWRLRREGDHRHSAADRRVRGEYRAAGLEPLGHRRHRALTDSPIRPGFRLTRAMPYSGQRRGRPQYRRRPAAARHRAEHRQPKPRFHPGRRIHPAPGRRQPLCRVSWRRTVVGRRGQRPAAGSITTSTASSRSASRRNTTRAPPEDATCRSRSRAGPTLPTARSRTEPIVGITAQHITVDGFTETGGFYQPAVRSPGRRAGLGDQRARLSGRASTSATGRRSPSSCGTTNSSRPATGSSPPRSRR